MRFWEQVVEFQKDGTLLRRDRRHDELIDCKATGRDATKWLVAIPIIQVRAKLINLQQDDPSILADIDWYEGMKAELAPVKINPYRLVEVFDEYCSDHAWLPGMGGEFRWRCSNHDQAVVAWKRHSTICSEVGDVLNKGAAKLHAQAMKKQIKRIATRVVKELFPNESTCVE